MLCNFLGVEECHCLVAGLHDPATNFYKGKVVEVCSDGCLQWRMMGLQGKRKQ